MTRQMQLTRSVTRRISVSTRLSMAALLALGAIIAATSVASADRDSPAFHRGACQGAYPGWLRGVVDGYNGSATSPVENKTLILLSVPTPKVLKPGDERLGWGDGLEEGHKLGVDYGVELGRAARTPESNSKAMDKASTALGNYLKFHCGGIVARLDWNKTVMDDRGTTTVTSLNEAQLTMSLAASANQIAIGAENLARCAREAEAKGDIAAAVQCRAEAKSSAQIAVSFADLAKSHEAAGRAEAAVAVRDAQDAAERARKAAADGGG